MCLLINTFSSLTSDLNEEDWDDAEKDSSAAYDDDDEEQDADIDATGELGSLAQPEERIQWLERKVVFVRNSVFAVILCSVFLFSINNSNNMM